MRPLGGSRRTGLALVAPALVVLGAVTVFPAFWVLWLSLQRRIPIFGVADFEGMGNYLFLAGDPRFRPQTSALKAVLPWLDDLVDGSSAQSIARFMLTSDREAPRASDVWKEKTHAARH